MMVDSGPWNWRSHEITNYWLSEESTRVVEADLLQQYHQATTRSTHDLTSRQALERFSNGGSSSFLRADFGSMNVAIWKRLRE